MIRRQNWMSGMASLFFRIPKMKNHIVNSYKNFMTFSNMKTPTPILSLSTSLRGKGPVSLSSDDSSSTEERQGQSPFSFRFRSHRHPSYPHDNVQLGIRKSGTTLKFRLLLSQIPCHSFITVIHKKSKIRSADTTQRLNEASRFIP